MWDIKLKLEMETVWWLPREGRQIVKGKRGQIHGDRGVLDSGWWAHSAIHRPRIPETRMIPLLKVTPINLSKEIAGFDMC